MTWEGTVRNGVIVPDEGVQLPDGIRVRIEPEDGDDLAPPPEPYDRDKELAILREALEDVRAGRGVPFEEFMANLADELKLPPIPPE